jgi:hypothetical protein
MTSKQAVVGRGRAIDGSRWDREWICIRPHCIYKWNY